MTLCLSFLLSLDNFLYMAHYLFHFTIKISLPTNSPDFHLKSKKLFDINALEWV